MLEKNPNLPPKLQEISSPLCLLVKNMESQLPTGPGKSADLTKLPEAKDFFNSINKG